MVRTILHARAAVFGAGGGGVAVTAGHTASQQVVVAVGGLARQAIRVARPDTCATVCTAQLTRLKTVNKYVIG